MKSSNYEYYDALRKDARTFGSGSVSGNRGLELPMLVEDESGC